ncbi:MAG: PAS domain-containing protein [Nitrospirae bacterium]|nr:PAS domain-containing protein [Nitrospirota bacterium]
MKRGIFKRIFILYAAILVLALLFIEFSITGTLREQHLNGLQRNLAIQASLIADRVSFSASGQYDELCRQTKAKTGARVTIILRDGTVIGDSDSESSHMDNHAGRPEIQRAALNGTGMFIRYSETVKHELLYVAYRVTAQGKPSGYVRLSLPLEDVDHAVNAAKIKIILVVSFIILATGAFSLWQIDYLRRLTRQIKDFSTALVPHGIGKRLFLTDAGEFSEIADSLNSMSEELRTVIEEHEQERKRLNEILRSIPDALLILDRKGVVLLSSAATRTFFGDIPLMGRPFIEVVRNNEFFSLLDEVRNSGAAGTTEFTLDRPDELHCVVRISPLFHGNDVLSGFVAIFHDITQLKKLEQVRKDFVANISHELKTPITAIQGFAETLLEGALDDREHARKFLETIRSNSKRINSLVDDLMTISKIELGVIGVDKSAVAFDDIADAVLPILREKAAAKGIDLRTSIAPDIGSIMADRDRLIQILTNLVDNAIKFTDKGGVTFGIGEENGRTFLFVEDTGIGISEKHLARLGERFYRVDTARSRKMGGTGLGLAIVKHLVKAHGWDMKIESIPEKGTKVKIFVS